MPGMSAPRRLGGANVWPSAGRSGTVVGLNLSMVCERGWPAYVVATFAFEYAGVTHSEYFSISLRQAAK